MNYANMNQPKGLDNYSAGQAVEARQAEIPNQMEALERTLKGCLQGLDVLGAKLENSVMRPECASEGADAPSPPNATAIGGYLRSMTQIAAHLNARIQSMTQRLEV